MRGKHDPLEVGRTYQSCGGLYFVVLEQLELGWRALVLADGDFSGRSPQPGELLEFPATSLFHEDAVPL